MGKSWPADAVLFNGDVAALATAHLGSDAARAVAAPGARSLSAVTWAVRARTVDGFPLLRHNVFFSDAYESEFEDVFRRNRLPRGPTVYVCAQDRGDEASAQWV